MKIKDDRHQDLIYIKDFFNANMPMKLNQTQTVEFLLSSVANVIRNTGDLQFRSANELKTEKVADGIKNGIKY